MLFNRNEMPLKTSQDLFFARKATWPDRKVPSIKDLLIFLIWDFVGDNVRSSLESNRL